MRGRPARGAAARDGVSDLSGPIRQRHDRQLRRQRRRLLALVVGGVLAVAATWAVAFSPLLGTRDVRVEGTALLSRDQVLDAAQVPMGLPLVRQDTRGIGERTMSLAPVRGVEVTRSWPDTVRLEVSERSPVAAFPVDGGHLLVDAEGVAYATVADLPDGVLEAEGSGSSATAEAVGRTLAALPAGIRDRVTGVRADSPAAVVLRLDQGRSVVWGGPEDGELKAEVLGALLDRVPDAATYDVSAPAFPTTR